MRRYNEYKCSLIELVRVLSIYLLILACIAYFFYQSYIFFLISLVSIPIYLKTYKQKMINKQKSKLAEEFSEVLYSVTANAKAGYSLENAFLESKKDLIHFFGEKSLMVNEIENIRKSLSISITLESILVDLGERSEVEDIKIFAKVFEAAKRNGGNINQVLETTADTVRAKFEVEKEIQVLIAEKRLELRIMELVPFFIIAYISITSKGYFSILYHNLRGNLFMTACLILYGLAIYLGSKVVKINV